MARGFGIVLLALLVFEKLKPRIICLQRRVGVRIFMLM